MNISLKWNETAQRKCSVLQILFHYSEMCISAALANPDQLIIIVISYTIINYLLRNCKLQYTRYRAKLDIHSCGNVHILRLKIKFRINTMLRRTYEARVSSLRSCGHTRWSWLTYPGWHDVRLISCKRAWDLSWRPVTQLRACTYGRRRRKRDGWRGSFTFSSLLFCGTAKK